MCSVLSHSQLCQVSRSVVCNVTVKSGITEYDTHGNVTVKSGITEYDTVM